MKKILLIVPVLALFAAAFAGCTQQQKWNHEQRKAMREALHDYRKMVYLEDLTDPEFVLFTDEVANTLESSYPVYTTFIEMAGVNDTVDMVVVTTIVEELEADARNMRHIFPYDYLVAEGVLPEGVDQVDVGIQGRIDSAVLQGLLQAPGGIGVAVPAGGVVPL